MGAEAGERKRDDKSGKASKREKKKRDSDGESQKGLTLNNCC